MQTDRRTRVETTRRRRARRRKQAETAVKTAKSGETATAGSIEDALGDVAGAGQTEPGDDIAGPGPDPQAAPADPGPAAPSDVEPAADDLHMYGAFPPVLYTPPRCPNCGSARCVTHEHTGFADIETVIRFHLCENCGTRFRSKETLSRVDAEHYAALRAENEPPENTTDESEEDGEDGDA